MVRRLGLRLGYGTDKTIVDGCRDRKSFSPNNVLIMKMYQEIL